MSELPPPMPPPPGTPTNDRGPNPLSTDPSEWDWDRIRDLAERWFKPLLDQRSWIALGYLGLGMLSGIGFFVAMMALAGITFGLSFIGVGLLLIGPWFAMVTAFGAAERAMASWVGVDILQRDLKDPGRFGWRSITDPERWRIAGYVALNSILAPVLFTLGSFCYSLVVRVVFGQWTSSLWDFFPANLFGGVFAIVILIAALGAAPRLAVAVATLKANSTAWFLGPDRLAEAEERVSVLSSQRQDILDAVASERRRIERNLHDGVQQQLVAIGLDLGMAEQHLDDDPTRARELVTGARAKVQGSIGELR